MVSLKISSNATRLSTLVLTLLLPACYLCGQEEESNTLPVPETIAAGKPWTLDLTVQQGYDDNIFTQTKNPTSSFVSQLIPSFSIHINEDHYQFHANYELTVKAYENRNKIFDIGHQLTPSLTYMLTERLQLNLQNRLSLTQEPALFDDGTSIRNTGDRIANDTSASLRYRLTERLHTSLTYELSWKDADDPLTSVTTDSITHRIKPRIQLQLMERTTLSGEYSFGIVDYSLSPRDHTEHSTRIDLSHELNEFTQAGIYSGFAHRNYDLSTIKDPLLPLAGIYATVLFAEDSTLFAGYDYLSLPTDSDAFAEQQIHKFKLTHSQPLGRLFRIEQSTSVAFASFDEDVRLGNTAPTSSEERIYTYEIKLSYSLTETIQLQCGTLFDLIDSDIPSRGYSRNRASIGATWQF